MNNTRLIKFSIMFSYQFLRKCKKVFLRPVYLLKTVFIAKDLFLFLKKDKEKRFSVSIHDLMPVLFENTPFTRFDTHYVYHTAWAARKVQESNVAKHTDISSSLYFSCIVSAFVPVYFFDYRPAKLKLSNLHTAHADLMSLPFKDGSIMSLSCMHTVEHVGLGRYGDPIDPEGDLKATKELSRVLSRGGQLIFVVPVGKPRIQFNAHRIYSYQMVMKMFPDLKLKEFSLIPDNAQESGMISNASPELVQEQEHGCGCFVFTRE